MGLSVVCRGDCSQCDITPPINSLMLILLLLLLIVNNVSVSISQTARRPLFALVSIVFSCINRRWDKNAPLTRVQISCYYGGFF